MLYHLDGILPHSQSMYESKTVTKISNTPAYHLKVLIGLQKRFIIFGVAYRFKNVFFSKQRKLEKCFKNSKKILIFYFFLTFRSLFSDNLLISLKLDGGGGALTTRSYRIKQY
jgi:hypothetical protein